MEGWNEKIGRSILAINSSLYTMNGRQADTLVWEPQNSTDNTYLVTYTLNLSGWFLQITSVWLAVYSIYQVKICRYHLQGLSWKFLQIPLLWLGTQVRASRQNQILISIEMVLTYSLTLLDLFCSTLLSNQTQPMLSYWWLIFCSYVPINFYSQETFN